MRYIELVGRRVRTAATGVERLSLHAGELVLRLYLVIEDYLENRASLRPKPLDCSSWQDSVQEVRAVEEGG